MISLLASDEKNIEICYFSNFKAKSNLRKCTDSPELSQIAEMRNNIEIRYFSIFEAQSSLRQEKRLSGEMQQYQGFNTQHVFFCFFFVFWSK